MMNRYDGAPVFPQPGFLIPPEIPEARPNPNDAVGPVYVPLDWVKYIRKFLESRGHKEDDPTRVFRKWVALHLTDDMN